MALPTPGAQEAEETDWRSPSGVVFNAHVPADASSDYRVAPALAARLLGLALAFVGVLVFGAAVVVALLGLPIGTIVAVAVAGVAAVGLAAWWASRRAYVVHLDEVGYRVRFVRGAGTTAARWSDVQDAGTRTVADTPCLVLRLRDGRTTTIPFEAVAVDPPTFVRDVTERLSRG